MPKKAAAKKAPAKKTKAKAKKIDVPMMVTASRVKTFVSDIYDKRTAGDFVSELNEVVAKTIDCAVRRCDGNQRGTVRATDL